MSMKRSGLWILIVITGGLCAGAQTELIPPAEIAKCSQLVGGPLEIDTKLNPYYLRGNLFGTGTMVYAVGVRQNSPVQAGIVLCPATGSPVVLLHGWEGRFAGKEISAKFAVAPEWEVFTRANTNSLLRQNHHPGIAVGESIAMIWEDGIGLLYSDGSRLRWAPGLQ
jgi:hypothetical protein